MSKVFLRTEFNYDMDAVSRETGLNSQRIILAAQTSFT